MDYQEKKKRMDLLYENKNMIIERFSCDEIVEPFPMTDRGLEGLWPRFHRALMNQIEDGDATVSRYSIWANTVRDNILEGLRLAETGDIKKSRQHLVQAANSMAAFSEVQSYFDPL